MATFKSDDNRNIGLRYSSLNFVDNLIERITRPRDTWQEAGLTLSPPRLEDRHLDAGIGYTHERGYYFHFKTRRTGKWIQRSNFLTPDEALEAYNRLLSMGVEPITFK